MANSGISDKRAGPGVPFGRPQGVAASRTDPLETAMEKRKNIPSLPSARQPREVMISR
jgi:hypothetical protein